MGEIEMKRCGICVGTLTTVALGADDGFDTVGSAVVCPRCDRDAKDQVPLYPPFWWWG
jgi:hypothetical protein